MSRITVKKKQDFFIRPAFSSETDKITGLFTLYLSELNQFDKDLPDTNRGKHRLAKEKVISFGESNYAIIYAILLDQLIIGFFVIGVFPRTYSRDDVHIMHFYIDKDYRHKGYGRKAVQQFIETSDFYHLTDAISMFVLNNSPAIFFWSKVLEELDYTDLVSTGKITSPSSDKNRFGELPKGRFCFWSPL